MSFSYDSYSPMFIMFAVYMKRIAAITTCMIVLPLFQAHAVDSVGTSVSEPGTLLFLGFVIAGLGVFFFWKSTKGRKYK